jgi:TonB-linked SusC/RagA family outer membrane protein
MIRFVVARCGVFATMVAALGPGRLLAHAPLTAGNAAVRQQQQTILIGRVVDSATQRPISAVQVSVAGTQLGARTDDDGRYRIAGLAPGTHRVRFTSIGYTPIERAIQVDPRRPATLDVAMPSVAAQLASVVVVGYGTQSAATVTGSVSTVQGAQLEAIPVPNLSNTIGGKVAGVMSLNTSGEPGADGATLRVRGARTLNDNSPLVVIDGVPDRAGGLDRLSASDIESVSVLKDASAAIYGARAANGVILITTKRGTSGATSITLNANYGVSQPTRLPKMADAATYMTMLDEADVYRGLTPRYTQAQIDAFRAGGDAWRYPNTDWFDATLKSASPVSRADLSMRGGAERMKYFLSLGGDRQDGYYRNSGTKYDQYSFRTNLDGRATERLSVQLDLTGRLEDRNYSNRSASEIFRAIMRGKPNLPAYWPNGLPGPDIEYGNNPVVISTAATGYNRDQRYYLQGTLGGTLQIPGVDGLSLKGSAAYDQQFQYQKSWRTPWTLYTWDGTTRDDAGDPTLVAGLRGYNQPELQQNDNRNNGVLLNLIADYRKQAGDHMLGALAGVERQTVDYSSLSAFRKYFVSDQLAEIFAGGDAEKQNGGTAGLARRQNYFTRLNYSYAGRYMVELIGRRDGSYIFAPDRRFGFFPGVSAGWRISDEAFVKNNVPFIDDLKLRASWGRTGNDRIDQWQYLASYGYGSGYVFGSTEVKSLYPTRTPNPDVTWETAEQTNVALDGTLFHDRVSFTIEAFGEKRDNILWYRNASVPQSTGLSISMWPISSVAVSRSRSRYFFGPREPHA